MPPLKEPVFEPSVAEAAEPVHTLAPASAKKEEKPRLQPREVAKKAIKEIATIPPRLMLFSILGAVGLILVIVVAVFFHVRSEDDGATAAPQPTKVASPRSGEPVAQTAAARESKSRFRLLRKLHRSLPSARSKSAPRITGGRLLRLRCRS